MRCLALPQAARWVPLHEPSPPWSPQRYLDQPAAPYLWQAARNRAGVGRAAGQRAFPALPKCSQQQPARERQCQLLRLAWD